MKKNELNKKTLFKWAKDLFPINRSLTGKGNLETLNYIKEILPNLKIKKIKSGTLINSWKIPKEWEVNEAFIEDSKGNKILDFKKNNLHLVGYSSAKSQLINFKDLSKKIHYLKNQPNSIPYVTSYYKKDWGFCMSYNQFKKLNKKEIFKVKIDSKFKKGNLIFGESFFPGKTKKEILISTNICHPSMANNELSGIIVSTALGKFISRMKNRYYSYRILYLPETIGSIGYIQKNKIKLKKNVIAGFVVVCVGDHKAWSFLESPSGNTLADNVSKYILKKEKIKYNKYDYQNDRGSDERQFCWPGIDLPICSIMRSKYATYKEYHTSNDNLKFISPTGLWESFYLYKKIFECLEKNNTFYKNTFFGKSEPFLTKYKLINTLSNPDGLKNSAKNQFLILKIIYLTTIKRNLIDLLMLTKENLPNLKKYLEVFLKKKLLYKYKY